MNKSLSVQEHRRASMSLPAWTYIKVSYLKICQQSLFPFLTCNGYTSWAFHLFYFCFRKQANKQKSQMRNKQTKQMHGSQKITFEFTRWQQGVRNSTGVFNQNIWLDLHSSATPSSPPNKLKFWLIKWPPSKHWIKYTPCRYINIVSVGQCSCWLSSHLSGFTHSHLCETLMWHWGYQLWRKPWICNCLCLLKAEQLLSNQAA